MENIILNKIYNNQSILMKLNIIGLQRFFNNQNIIKLVDKDYDLIFDDKDGQFDKPSIVLSNLPKPSNANIEITTTNKNLSHKRIFIKKSDILSENISQILINVLSTKLSPEKSNKLKILISSKQKPKNAYLDIHLWGDHILALTLKKYLERYDIECKILVYHEWNFKIEDFNKNLILLGLYTIEKHNNGEEYYGWLVYPKINISKLIGYKHLFVSSNKHLKKIQKNNKITASLLLQCSDLEIFYPDEKIKDMELPSIISNYHFDRKSLNLIKNNNFAVNIYGKGWDNIKHDSIIYKGILKKDKLKNKFQNSLFIINDHMDEMIKQGYFSNKSIDIIASGGLLIDNNPILKELFPDQTLTYEEFTFEKAIKKKKKLIKKPKFGFDRINKIGLTFDTICKILKYKCF